MAVLMKNNNNNKNLPKIISAPQETYNYKKRPSMNPLKCGIGRLYKEPINLLLKDCKMLFLAVIVFHLMSEVQISLRNC